MSIRKREFVALLVPAFIGMGILALKAQGISIPNTFVNGTPADAPLVNANFAALANNALNRTGGTMTGTLTSRAVVPVTDDLYDLGSGSFRFHDLFLSRNATVPGLLTPGAVSAGTTKVTSTATGTVNNWAPGIVGNTVVYWSGGSDLTITGLAGGTTGLEFTFVNTGSATAYLSHQSGSSSAGNKLRDFITSGVTPVASGGAARFNYDGTDWRMLYHEQGAWVAPTSTPTFSGNGAMTWTAVSAIAAARYRVSGRTLSWFFDYQGTVGGVVNTQLRVTMPNGYSTSNGGTMPCINTTAPVITVCQANLTNVLIYGDIGTSGVTWGAGTQRAQGTVVFEVD